MTLKENTLEQPNRVHGAQYVEGGDYRVEVKADFHGGAVHLMHRSKGPDGRCSAYQCLHTFRRHDVVTLNLAPGDLYFDAVEAENGPPTGVRPGVFALPRRVKVPA